ncbi:MAG: hypothetical protein EA361_00815 [Bacteroidetes bacterium]|nr:MAG: hypothetical protein EA361_00815 [Bacteroidota bacterium]
MQISWEKSKRRLAVLWFSGAGFVFAIMLFQTILGRYGVDSSDAWGWYLPTIMPTLSLIIGVLVMDAVGKGLKIQTVDRFFFRLSFSLSLTYLFVVSLTILMQPFSPLSAVELMTQSNFWLGPFQGLVSASLGAFFIKGAKE